MSSNRSLCSGHEMAGAGNASLQDALAQSPYPDQNVVQPYSLSDSSWFGAGTEPGGVPNVFLNHIPEDLANLQQSHSHSRQETQEPLSPTTKNRLRRERAKERERNRPSIPALLPDEAVPDPPHDPDDVCPVPYTRPCSMARPDIQPNLRCMVVLKADYKYRMCEGCRMRFKLAEMRVKGVRYEGKQKAREQPGASTKPPKRKPRPQLIEYNGELILDPAFMHTFDLDPRMFGPEGNSKNSEALDNAAFQKALKNASSALPKIKSRESTVRQASQTPSADQKAGPDLALAIGAAQAMQTSTPEAGPSSSAPDDGLLRVKICSVKTCHNPIPVDYAWKMCEPCRIVYREWSVQKRARKREKRLQEMSPEQRQHFEARQAAKLARKEAHKDGNPQTAETLFDDTAIFDPYTPPRPCSVPKCKNYVPGNSVYKRCDEHRREGRMTQANIVAKRERLKIVYKKAVEDGRDPEEALRDLLIEEMDSEDESDGNDDQNGEDSAQKKKKKRKRNDSELLRNLESVSIFDGQDNGKNIGKRKYATYTCSGKDCQNILNPSLSWRLCQGCKDMERLNRVPKVKKRSDGSVANDDEVSEYSIIPVDPTIINPNITHNGAHPTAITALSEVGEGTLTIQQWSEASSGSGTQGNGNASQTTRKDESGWIAYYPQPYKTAESSLQHAITPIDSRPTQTESKSAVPPHVPPTASPAEFPIVQPSSRPAGPKSSKPSNSSQTSPVVQQLTQVNTPDVEQSTPAPSVTSVIPSSFEPTTPISLSPSTRQDPKVQHKISTSSTLNTMTPNQPTNSEIINNTSEPSVQQPVRPTPASTELTIISESPVNNPMRNQRKKKATTVREPAVQETILEINTSAPSLSEPSSSTPKSPVKRRRKGDKPKVPTTPPVSNTATAAMYPPYGYYPYPHYLPYPPPPAGSDMISPYATPPYMYGYPPPLMPIPGHPDAATQMPQQYSYPYTPYPYTYPYTPPPPPPAQAFQTTMHSNPNKARGPRSASAFPLEALNSFHKFSVKGSQPYNVPPTMTGPSSNAPMISLSKPSTPTQKDSTASSSTPVMASLGAPPIEANRTAANTTLSSTLTSRRAVSASALLAQLAGHETTATSLATAHQSIMASEALSGDLRSPDPPLPNFERYLASLRERSGTSQPAISGTSGEKTTTNDKKPPISELRSTPTEVSKPKGGANEEDESQNSALVTERSVPPANPSNSTRTCRGEKCGTTLPINHPFKFCSGCRKKLKQKKKIEELKRRLKLVNGKKALKGSQNGTQSGSLNNIPVEEDSLNEEDADGDIDAEAV